MEVITKELTKVFLYSLLFGVLLFLVYDVLRFFRVCFKDKRKLCIALDIIFMLIASLVTFILTLAFNKGKIRIFICVGEITGFLIMLMTVGRLSVRLFTHISKTAVIIKSKITQIFKKVILNPLKKIYRILYNESG